MAFKASSVKKHRGVEGGLSLTSLMDAMTIILLFLLNQYSADGALVSAAEGLKLPESLNKEKPHQAMTLAVSQNEILVNNIPITQASEFTGPLGPTGYMITSLYNYLEGKAEEMISLGNDAAGEPIFTGEILIQGDVKIDYNSFLRVVYTASQAGFVKVKLVTVQSGE